MPTVATAPTTNPAPVKAPKAKIEAKPNTQLVAILKGYDTNVEEAKSYWIQFIEFIEKEQLDRATVIASIMSARGVVYDTANSEYSRIKVFLNNKEVVEKLKSGEITLTAARKLTKNPQKNPASSKPEALAATYDKALKLLVSTAKQLGYKAKDVLTGVQAEMKASEVA